MRVSASVRCEEVKVIGSERRRPISVPIRRILNDGSEVTGIRFVESNMPAGPVVLRTAAGVVSAVDNRFPCQFQRPMLF
ncbi:hypothetical protein HPP92_006305 [Vanilla planifolia]|uniref:Uncharacterized protein n=1 Tax=Vanilla planifolia TaxID=51239 RepID=A0A835V8K0_VANPL|nr:hypothetical protein HPP92_006305 [Vanilla planifolia]